MRGRQHAQGRQCVGGSWCVMVGAHEGGGGSGSVRDGVGMRAGEVAHT